MSINKLVKKYEYRQKHNPGHYESYDQPLRMRSTTFNSKKSYNRQKARKELRGILNEN
jgi:hypothetical protein